VLAAYNSDIDSLLQPDLVLPQSGFHLCRHVRLEFTVSNMYQPLETPRSIRSVDIHPGTGEDAMRCSIRHQGLDERPDFEAISYVWGDPVFSARIMCDSRVVHITPSLCRSLRRVRLNTAVRTVWVDGLSINQQDDTERSQQVQLMRDIYQDA